MALVQNDEQGLAVVGRPPTSASSPNQSTGRGAAVTDLKIKQEPYWEYVSLVVSLDKFDDDVALTEHVSHELGTLIQQAMPVHQESAAEAGTAIKFTEQWRTTCCLPAPRPEAAAHRPRGLGRREASAIQSLLGSASPLISKRKSFANARGHPRKSTHPGRVAKMGTELQAVRHLK
jgi:hypothetical protein